jgi:RND family efflux transporter MFP subunit
MATHSRVRSFFVYLAGLLIVGIAAATVLVLWQERDSSLSAATKALAETVERGPKVQVVTVQQGPKERLITLLGDTRAIQVATVYSKVSGYLKSISVDRGDMVQAGQVLAEVDSAETDRQYDSATTDLENKRRNAARAQELVKHGSMSVQAAEQAQTDFHMATANVAQIATLKSYELLRAPFAGRVTARFVDVGALVQNSTTNQTSNQPVLTVSDSSRLRVDIYVEQRDVPFVHVGDIADVADGASSERRIQAKVARTSGELDPRTRTLFVELDVDNSSHFLVPGAFAYVTLHVPIDSYPEIPVTGLLTRGTATYVADVGDDNLVHLRAVKIANSDGSKVSLREGAHIGQRVAINLPDEVADGGRVQPVNVGTR